MDEKRIFSIFPLHLTKGMTREMEEYYSVDDFFTIDKIDAHLHYYSDKKSFLKLAEQYNIRLLSIHVDFLEEEWITPDKQMPIAQKMMNSNPAFFAFLGAVPMIHPLRQSHIPHAIEHIKKEIQQGAAGVKIWKNVGMKISYNGAHVMIDNSLFQPIFDYLIENNITLLGHFGEPKNCWLPLDKMTVASDKKYYAEHPEFHMYLHPHMPSYEEQINATNTMLKQNPALNFVGAHLGSSEYSIAEMAKRLDAYPNLMFDIAERVCHLQYQSISNHQGVFDFIIKYQDRLMYGSDMVFTDAKSEYDQIEEVKSRWLNQWCFLTQSNEQTTWEVNGTFKGLSLPKTVIDKIYFHNCIKAYPRLRNYFLRRK